MLRFALALLALFAVVPACASDNGAPAAASRFVGDWFVEETEAHALYGASTYAFAADGTVELVWNADLASVPPQGHVRSADGTVLCEFGQSWQSPDDATLVVAATCSDDLARDIVLAFPADSSANAAGVTVDLISVAGETDWQPPTWGWAFYKCPGDTATPCTARP